MKQQNYHIAFIAAVLLHLGLALFLFKETNHHAYATKVEDSSKKNLDITTSAKPKPEIIKAVSVDQTEVEKAVKRLKAERLAAREAAEKKQRELDNQAEIARKKRIEEQKRLKKLKQQAEKLAKARKQALLEEEKRLRQLAHQKKEEEKRLAEMKKKQEQIKKQQEAEAQRLKALKEKQAAEEARKAREEKLKAEAERERQEAIRQANAAREKARINGEVDKYKALIVNAISQQWILPDDIDNNLSSQFRIRLAPDGSVLEVSLTKSSGDAVLDRSARSAIYKASPLPVPKDPDAFKVFRDISLTVRPEQVRG